MTNLEWLRSLSAEELANKLHERPVCQFCVNYNYKTGCMFSIVEDDESHCVEGMTKWLKAEHVPKLKPCPCCGGEAVIDDNDMGVYCNDCGMGTTWGATIEDAIKTWNRRVDDGKVDGDCQDRRNQMHDRV